MSLQSVPKLSTVNFPSDREYTHNALIEELVLIERHCRDESWRLCSCNPEKHLPAIAALGSEGQGFAESSDEREFMRKLQVQARIWKDKIKKGRFSEKDADALRAFAREARHHIEARDWRGERDIEEQMNYEVPNSVIELVETLKKSGIETKNPLSLPDIEEEMTWKMIKYLSKKYKIPLPKKITFTDSCNPRTPTAVHIQRDQVTIAGIVPKPDLDELIFCRGGVTAFAVAHEFDHFRKHHKGFLVANEEDANLFALKVTRNNLYTGAGYNKSFIRERENKLAEKGMALDTAKGLEVGIGLSVAKLVDKYDLWWETQFPGYAQSAKVAAGAILTYLGLQKKGPLPAGWAKNIAVFAGMELILTEVFKMIPGFAPAPVVARAAVAPVGPVAIPGAPGRAVITAASPYGRMWVTPTRLTAGYPQVAQVDSKWVQVRV